MKGYLLLPALLCVAGLAAAQDAPVGPVKRIKAEQPAKDQPPPGPQRVLPAVVPHPFSQRQEADASFPEAAATAAAPGPSTCQLRLRKIAAFQPLAVLAGSGECGAVDAVLLQSVILPDQAKVAITPPATLRCTMAEAVARWLREDVAPATLALGAPLRGVDEVDSYECRGRNRVRGATLSEHGRANALDVRAFTLANGKVIELTDANIAKDWRGGVRSSACARFSTVLGPSADGNHEEHIHLDLAERHGGYRMCEWDVRGPIEQAEKMESAARQMSAQIERSVPLPRPRPPANGGRRL